MRNKRSAAAVQNLLTCPYRISFVDETSSTNTDLKILAQQGEAEGFVLIADRQTDGRGRMGRAFHSPQGTGLYLSVLLRPQGAADEAVRMTVVAAVAAARAVRSVFDIETGIKWVNDLYYKERKVCGILTESSLNLTDGTLDYAVCGVGFNVFPPQEGFPENLQSVAGALCDTYDEAARSRLAAAFLNEFYRGRTEAWSSILAEYRRRCVLTGKSVTSPTGAFAGVGEVLGIDDSAGLVVRLSDGSIRVLQSGEVSVRIYE